MEAPQPAKSTAAPIPSTTLMAMIRGLLVFRFTVMMIHGGHNRFAFPICGQGMPPARQRAMTGALECPVTELVCI